MLAGVHISGHPGLAGNSDADVVLHALCNAISSVSGESVLGAVTDQLCAQGITDSSVYVKRALAGMSGRYRVCHIAVSLECVRPKIAPHVDVMRASIARLCALDKSQVGITATSGEGLSAFGRGEGIQAFVSLSAEVIHQ